MANIDVIYAFDSSSPHENYASGLKEVPDNRKKAAPIKPRGLPAHKRPKFNGGSFEPCLKHNNSENQKPPMIVKTHPKWNTKLSILRINKDTGEIIEDLGYHNTNEMNKGKQRRSKAIEKFCSYFEPKFKSKEVSLMFLTFTRMDFANIDFSGMLDNIKYGITKRLGIRLRGYVWVLEISERLHAHYHLCIAIDRCNFKNIPNELKFEKLWGQRTQITFVKKTIRGYLMKYMEKCQYSILGLRSYGISKNFY